MNSANSCFISYRHTNDPDAHSYVKAFVRHLTRHLKWWLPTAPIFFDEDGLQVGDKFHEELAFQLCRSACLIMFYSPLHFDSMHPYCALEYHAMLELERRRLGKHNLDLRNKGLIFPIVFRGLDFLPGEIRTSRNYINFDNILVESDFEHPDNQKCFLELAKEIFKRYQEQHNAGIFNSHDCNDFRFPDKSGLGDWLAAVSPFRQFEMPSF